MSRAMLWKWKLPSAVGFAIGHACILLMASPHGACAETAPSPLTAAETQRNRIALHLSQPRFDRAHWGVKIIRVDTGATLFEHNNTRSFVPASVTKCFTCALALQKLGPRHRIATSVYATRKPDAQGNIQGDLIVYGRGDPSFTSSRAEDDRATSLDRIALLLREAGVRAIEGELVLDATYFWGRISGTGWPVDDLAYSFSAPVDAFNLDDNTVDLIVGPGKSVGAPAWIPAWANSTGMTLQSALTTVETNGVLDLQVQLNPWSRKLNVWGSVPLGVTPMTNGIAVADPTARFASVLLERLRLEGIKCSGKTRILHWDDVGATTWSAGSRVELGHIYSPPISELVADTLKPSNNQKAHLLFLQVGAQSGASDKSPSERANMALKEFMKETGLPEPLPVLEEGSGLSRRHLVSPDHVVALLRHMDLRTDEAARAFVQGLPLAGREGTMRRRFVGTASEGVMRAKTGTLDGVHSLCGYAETGSGVRVAFAVFLNSYFSEEGEASARKDLDELALLLLGLP